MNKKTRIFSYHLNNFKFKKDGIFLLLIGLKLFRLFNRFFLLFFTPFVIVF